jgi:HD-GYP domain-containing protein (c-di-GMP phosphodiesterase class II)
MKQPLVGIGTVVVAPIALAASWSGGMPDLHGRSESAGAALLAVCLIAAVAGAYRFPVYVRHNTKVCLFTVPLYLMATCLDPPLAAAAAGLGILSGELLVRSRHGSLPCDIATHTGRWVVVALVGSHVAHTGWPATGSPSQALLLAATAVVLFAGDVLTAPLALAPICDEPVGRLILSCVRQGGLIEGGQYVVGLAVALAMQQQVWTFPLFGLPVVLIYLLSRPEIDPDAYQLLESLADSIDLRDPYSVGHSGRVVDVTAGILEELGRTGQEAALILAAARVHDVGKLEVPAHVLLTRGELTAEERALIVTHAERGAELLQRYPDFAHTLEMVRHHHERWDGTGYPDGLKGTEIPFGARIIAVAESFDAMTHDRAGRGALSVSQTAEILLDGRGRQWDPAIVDALLRSIDADCGLRRGAPADLALPETPEAIRSAVSA